MNNDEGWKQYAEHTDEIADAISEIVRNDNLTIDEVRELINAEDLKAQKKCFGTIWIGPKKQKKGTKRSSKDLKELFKEQCEELDELIETGSSYKDVGEAG